MRHDAPEVKYVTKKHQNLWIPKAFASDLHYAGFNDHANIIDNTFLGKNFCFHSKDPNMRAIYEF